MFLAAIQQPEPSTPKKTPLLQSEFNRSAKEQYGTATLYSNSSVVQERQRAKRKFQLQITSQVATARKQKNYSELKQWDMRRSLKLTMHRKIIDQLAQSILGRLAQSMKYVQTISHFISDKRDQYVSSCISQKKYAIESLPDPSINSQRNILSCQLYDDTNRVLNQCLSASSSIQRKYKSAAQRLSVILVESMEGIISQVELEHTVMRQRVNSSAAQMQIKNQQTMEKCQLLATEHSKNKSGLVAGIDMYVSQLQFIKKAYQQTLFQKKMARQILKFYHQAVSGEMLRCRKITQAVIAVSQAQQQIYPSIQYVTPEAQSDEQLSITNLYSVDQVIGQTYRQHIRQSLGILPGNSLHIQQLRTYFQQLQFKNFDSQGLILRQFSAYHKYSQTEFCQITIVITVDGFALLYSKQQRFLHLKQPYNHGTPQFIFKLHSGVAMRHLSDIEIQIQNAGNPWILQMLTAKEQGFIFNVYFLTAQLKKQFTDYVQKLIQ